MKPWTDAEIQKYRSLFPVTRKWIYLNHAAVAPVSTGVVEAVQQFNEEALHEGYTAGARWVKRFNEVRQAAARLCGATPEEIAFLKNTSHGLSLVSRGLKLKAGDEVIVSDQEFPSNVYPWMALESQGVVLKKIHSHAGKLQLGELDRLITSKTRVLSLSSVQYGSGYRLPIAELGKICRDLNIFFTVDAIQSLGAFPLDVQRDRVDFLAADAHKWLLGLEGIGIFSVRRDLIANLEPALLGWNSVKNPLAFDVIDFTLKETAERFEEGSHNGGAIYGLGAALDLLLEVGVQRIAERVLHLTGVLISGLQDLGMHLVSPLDPETRSGIVSFRLPHDPEGKGLVALEQDLFSKKIYVSVRHGSLRVSPHFYNTEEELHRLLAELKKHL